jgi:hypothetical protein
MILIANEVMQEGLDLHRHCPASFTVTWSGTPPGRAAHPPRRRSGIADEPTAEE